MMNRVPLKHKQIDGGGGCEGAKINDSLDPQPATWICSCTSRNKMLT